MGRFAAVWLMLILAGSAADESMALKCGFEKTLAGHPLGLQMLVLPFAPIMWAEIQLSGCPDEGAE